MQNFTSIVKGDYLQRTRSYAFLVTLAIAVYVAYTFVPAVDAEYATVRVGDFVGDHNSVWIGNVTAIMTSVFLSLAGFFLVNNSIKRDIDTEVGMIIATTSVGNFKYLMSKVLSNFLVLLSITLVVLVMSIGVFFYRARGFEFELFSFLTPYLLVTLPALFLVSCIAVTSEVWLTRRSVLQSVGFFVLFNMVMAGVQISKGSNVVPLVDPLGIKQVMIEIEKYVHANHGAEGRATSIGYIFGNTEKLKVFTFPGFTWPGSFILSRIGWMTFGVMLVAISSMLFHRFDLKEKTRSGKKRKTPAVTNGALPVQTIRLTELPPIVADYSIVAFIKTELLMLFRKGPRWFWLVNLGGMVALIFAPLSVAHGILLPILWFLQVNRFGDLITKEKTNRIHYFTFASYQPLKRLLTSQLIAGIAMAVLLAFPLLVRYTIELDVLHSAGIVVGAFFMVSLAACLGVVSGGKKLFEILFFMITYMNLKQIPFADYVGVSGTSTSLLIVLALSAMFAALCFAVRGYEIRHS